MYPIEDIPSIEDIRMHRVFIGYMVRRVKVLWVHLFCGLLLAVGFNSVCAHAEAQDARMDQMITGQEIPGPTGIVAGAFGRPTMVLDEASNLTQAVRVYSDSKYEAYVPDITTPGWAAWHALEFRHQGTYGVMVYRYERASQRTTHAFYVVDTRKATATIYAGWSEPQLISLNAKTFTLARVLAKVSSLVEHQLEIYKGPAAQQVLPNNRMVVARMAAGASGAQPPSTKSNSEAEGHSGNTLANQVTPPVVIRSADPEFTEQARSQKHGGNVLVGLTVDKQGNPQNVHVIQGVPGEAGLSQKAIEAVQQYRFKPARENGKPVPFDLNVNVQFRIF
jgi:TonB family protein